MGNWSAHLCGLPEFGEYTGQVELTPPVFLARADGRGICVDVCLALEITNLWSVGVVTTGCCCGHGRLDPFISVAPVSLRLMQDMRYTVQEHPGGRRDHFWPKTRFYAYPAERAVQIASMHAHHALWQGLLAYGWGEDTEKFGRGLAGRIARSIKEDSDKRP